MFETTHLFMGRRDPPIQYCNKSYRGNLDQRVKPADEEDGELSLHRKLPGLAVAVKITRHHAFNTARSNAKAL